MHMHLHVHKYICKFSSEGKWQIQCWSKRAGVLGATERINSMQQKKCTAQGNDGATNPLYPMPLWARPNLFIGQIWAEAIGC